jgi:UDP-N-acetylmuramyl pentapeptide phosphotransferase/UDP-N-acetylglucosamine-1-phosphate transferase
MWSIPHLILLFSVALTVSATATLFIVRKRGTLGQDSPDDHRKQHAAPVSRLGGAAIFLALALGFVLLAFRLPSFTQAWLPIIIANTLMFSLGWASRSMSSAIHLAQAVCNSAGGVCQ